MAFTLCVDIEIDNTRKACRQDNASVCFKHFIARGIFITFIPCAVIACALDAIAAIATTFASFVTLGLSKQVNKSTLGLLGRSNLLLQRLYLLALCTLNPPLGEANQSAWDRFKRTYILDPLLDYANRSKENNNVIIRHVVSRIAFAALGIATLILSGIDLVLAPLPVAVSLLTFGVFNKVNDMAQDCLEVSNIIARIYYSTLKCVNPWARMPNI